MKHIHNSLTVLCKNPKYFLLLLQERKTLLYFQPNADLQKN